MSNKIVKGLSLAVGAALLGSVSLANASAFQLTDLNAGYMVVGDEKPEGKCGEGKCGADKKDAEGKCGEGKCGAEKKGAEGKCGEGKCGAEKKAEEGKCGADKGKEGSCGGSR